MNKFTDNDKVFNRRQAALESYRRGLDRQMEEKRIAKMNQKKESSPEHVPYPQDGAGSARSLKILKQFSEENDTANAQRRGSRGQPRSKDIS